VKGSARSTVFLTIRQRGDPFQLLGSGWPLHAHASSRPSRALAEQQRHRCWAKPLPRSCRACGTGHPTAAQPRRTRPPQPPECPAGVRASRCAHASFMDEGMRTGYVRFLFLAQSQHPWMPNYGNSFWVCQPASGTGCLQYSLWHTVRNKLSGNHCSAQAQQCAAPEPAIQSRQACQPPTRTWMTP
jgi:hypothetical protein